MTLRFAGLVLMMGIILGSPLRAADVVFLPGPESVGVQVNGQLLTVLHLKGQKCPYFHPVVTMDGRRLTRQWPLAEATTPESRDHPHHIGLHYAHGEVRRVEQGKPGAPVDFWHNDRGVIRHDELTIKEARSQIILKNRWVNGEKVMARDRTRIEFGGDEQARWMDWTITITAPSEHGLILGDTKEGTFSIRLAEELAMRSADKNIPPGIAHGNLANSRGVRGKDVWGKRAEWCAAFGEVEGKPAAVALFDHPDNPRHPTWWMARDYGMFNINPFGISFFENKPAGTGDFALGAGESVTFRYRLLVLEKGFEPDEVQNYYQDYASAEAGANQVKRKEIDETSDSGSR